MACKTAAVAQSVLTGANSMHESSRPQSCNCAIFFRAIETSFPVAFAQGVPLAGFRMAMLNFYCTLDFRQRSTLYRRVVKKNSHWRSVMLNSASA